MQSPTSRSPSPTSEGEAPRTPTVVDLIGAAPDGLEAVEIVARLCPHGHTLEEIIRGACDTRPPVERALREAEAQKTVKYDGRRWCRVPQREQREPASQDRQDQQDPRMGDGVGSRPDEMASYIRNAVVNRPVTIATLIKEVVATQPLEASDIAAAVERRRSGIKKRSIIGELHLLYSRGEVVRVRWGRRGPEYGLPPAGVIVPPRDVQPAKKSPPRRSPEATTALDATSQPGVPVARWRTVRSLIVEVMETLGEPMTTAQVVDAVLALDPARHRKGIKNEMSRMREEKLFEITGKDAGGVYIHALKAGVKTGT